MNNVEKSVYGTGIYDGSCSDNVFYSTWVRMIERCYGVSTIKRHPSYIGCSVCDEWLFFSNFKLWMETQDYKGKELDKDLLIQGNKIYSSKSCVFVSSRINKLIINRSADRGKYSQGVSFYPATSKYRAQCRDGDKNCHIGYYKTETEASDSYKKFKYKLIKEVAEQQTEPLKTALLNYKIEGKER